MGLRVQGLRGLADLMGLSTGIRFLKPLNLFQLLLDAGDHSARSITHVSLCSCRPGYSLNPRTLNPKP